MSFSFLILAALPIYPGAQLKPLPQVNDPEAVRYWVAAPVGTVAQWYSKRLQAPIQRGREGAVRWLKINQKVRRIKVGSSSFTVVVKGVVVMGKSGGSTYFTLINRSLPSGSMQTQQPTETLKFGPTVPVGKATGGSDPGRYQRDDTSGRSIEGRSVKGSFE